MPWAFIRLSVAFYIMREMSDMGNVMTNEELVVKIQSGIDIANNMLQLWQQGYIGLCNAVDGYCLEENITFINYAALWIRQSMKRYIENNGSIVRVPINEQQLQRKYKKLVHNFELQIGRKPTEIEACYYMGISRKRLEHIKNDAIMEQIGSIDIYTGQDGDNTIGDLIPDDVDVESSVLDAIEKEELKEVLWPMVDTLPGKQPQVIRSLFQEGKTLKATGEEIGVTTERVRAIKQTALRELRKPSRSKMLAAYLPEAVIGMAYRHNGTREFNCTWTSSTELTALKIYEEVCTSLVTS